MQHLMQRPEVTVVETHMCRFGMTSHIHGRKGEHGPVKKPTGFATSSPCIAKRLALKCQGGHEHVHLMGGRAAGAQVYPEALCEAIVEGVVEQKKIDAEKLITVLKMHPMQLCSFIGTLGMSVGEIVHDRRGIGYPMGDWPQGWVDPVHGKSGGCDYFGDRPQYGIDILKTHMDALVFKNGISYARDDVGGKDLMPDLLVKAREEEMQYFKRLGVYKVVPRSMQREIGGKIIGARWVDVNTGDIDHPDCRSRLVGREFNVGRDDTLYAATPPPRGTEGSHQPCGDMGRDEGRQEESGHD